MQAGMLERDQILAGGHARAAVAHHAIGRRFSQNLLEIAAQRIRRPKGSSCTEVLQEMMIRRARNVAGDAIDRFDLTAIPLGRARVQKQ